MRSLGGTWFGVRDRDSRAGDDNKGGGLQSGRSWSSWRQSMASQDPPSSSSQTLVEDVLCGHGHLWGHCGFGGTTQSDWGGGITRGRRSL